MPMCNSTRRSAGAGCRVSGAGGSVEVGGLALGAHTGVCAWHHVSKGPKSMVVVARVSRVWACCIDRSSRREMPARS